jgi:hypothetical protein
MVGVFEGIDFEVTLPKFCVMTINELLRRGTADPLSTKRGDKTLSTPAFGTLVDMMREARLPRCGLDTGKVHLGPAFYVLGVSIETVGVALWHGRLWLGIAR